MDDLERDIPCVVFAINEWSKDWTPTSAPKVKKASLKLLELTGDRNSINNLPQFAHLLDELRVLYLTGEKQVSGNIASLRELRNLTVLSLYRTQVSGDIDSLSELQNLTQLDLDNTQVSGDIASLSELRNLTDLSLVGTQVEGDEQALKSKLPSCYIRL